MTQQEFQTLRVGDIIRGKFSGTFYVVIGNYGDRVTAVNTADVTNADEWDLMSKTQRAWDIAPSQKERHTMMRQTLRT